jgi:hypothetical protein
MSTGYDEDGVEDIVCLGPPGGEDDGGGDDPGGRTTACGSTLPRSATVAGTFYPQYYEGVLQPIWSGFYDEFVPNCLFGGWGQNFEDVTQAPMAFAPAGGVNSDFSFEVWVKLRMDPTFNYGAGPVVGASRFPMVCMAQQHPSFMTGPAAVPNIGFISYGGAIRARYIDAGSVELEVDITAAMSRKPGWRHLAINCARGGNIEAFVDGVSQGTQAGVIAYTRDDVLIGFGEDSESDKWGWHGPMATHSALMTPAQLSDSYRGKTVQLNANTEWATNPIQLWLNQDTRKNDFYYWMWVDNRTGAGAQYAPVGRTIDNWGLGPNRGAGRGSMDNLYALVPTGCPASAGYANPTIPDLTGNGRHLGMRCHTFGFPYVFSNDPFWR